MTAKQDLEKIARNLRRGIGRSVAKKNMKELGELAIELIVDRTRRGQGVSRTNARQRKLKSLSPLYVNFRRSTSLLDRSTTSPSKSNATLTGQMLRSMRVKEATTAKVRWGPNRRKRKGGKGLTNEQVGEFYSKKRPFNNLSRFEITKLARMIDKELQKKLRRV